METMSYENRIALGNLVPTLGQFKVMDKIPQYQQCEVHNLVEAPAEVSEVQEMCLEIASTVIWRL